MKNKSILFAVASKDGRVINQHFGHATRFLIYETSADGIEFLEERSVKQYCLGEETYTHPFEKERFMDVVNTIQDCQYVLVSMIGTIPEKRLIAEGISPVMMYDTIENGIQQVLTEKEEKKNNDAD